MTMTKFNVFNDDLSKGVHAFGTDTINVYLTNATPALTNTIDGNLADITAGNGYTAGGTALTGVTVTTTSGTTKITANGVTFTASGGTIGPFRYAVFKNVSKGSVGNRPLIGYIDYGAAVTLNDGESFKVGKDATGAAWDGTTPLHTLAY